MSKILEMRQKRAEVWDKARAFLDEHTNENGVMSAEDSQQYERMEQEVVDLGHTIDRMERAEQMEREMNEPVRQPLASRPEKNPGGRTGRANAVQTLIRVHDQRNLRLGGGPGRRAIALGVCAGQPLRINGGLDGAGENLSGLGAAVAQLVEIEIGQLAFGRAEQGVILRIKLRQMIAGHRDDRHAGLLTDLPKDTHVSSRAAGLRVQTAAAAG